MKKYIFALAIGLSAFSQGAHATSYGCYAVNDLGTNSGEGHSGYLWLAKKYAVSDCGAYTCVVVKCWYE